MKILNETETQSQIKIPVTPIFPDFQKHLDIDGNKNILFSGRFGVGKTHFLKEFFNNKQDKYETFHMYPVNYQISANEDILELIKYDILLELLDKDKKIFKENKAVGNKEHFLIFRSFLKSNLTIKSSLREVLSLCEISDLGKILGRPLNKLLDLDEEYQKFKKECEKGDMGIIEPFIEKNKSKNISETDFFSQFLKDKIQEQKGGKESVLILDDLDRLDPEHIFRLLNIFSAFFEYNNGGNKFGFDKIILVADYDNLKSIFHHKYGEKTDSEGYFDKFFSVDIYDYNMKKMVGDYIDEIIGQIKNENKGLEEALNSKESGYVGIFVKDILLQMLEFKLVNMREILKPINFQIDALSQGKYFEARSADRRSQFADIAIKVLISIFAGRKDLLINKLKIIKEKIITIPENEKNNYEAFIPYLLKSITGSDIQKTSVISYGKGKYSISKDNNMRGFKVTSGRLDELFYELLIEHTNKGNYIKEDRYAYAIMENQQN